MSPKSVLVIAGLHGVAVGGALLLREEVCPSKADDEKLLRAVVARLLGRKP